MTEDEEILDDISSNLLSGKLVVIQDAIKPEVAEMVFRLLNGGSLRWQKRTGSPPGTSPHYNVSKSELSRDTIPSTLSSIVNMFHHRKTKVFFESISGRSCENAVGFGFNRFEAEDYDNPISTFYQDHTLHVSWYLQKDWPLTHGGLFNWHPAKSTYGKNVNFRFNDLVLFLPGPSQIHSVHPVNFWVDDKRTLIDGRYSAGTSSLHSDMDEALDMFSTGDGINRLSFNQAGKLIREIDETVDSASSDALAALRDRLEEYIHPYDESTLVIN